MNFAKFLGATISQNIGEQLLLIFGVTFNVWREQLGSFKALQLVLKGFRLNLYLIFCQIYSVSIFLKHSQWLTRPIASNRKRNFSMSPLEFAKLSALGAHVPYMPKCLMCLRALKYYVPMCPHFSRAYAPKTTHKIYWGIYWGSLLYLVLLVFSGLFYFSFHSKPQLNLLLKLHTSILPFGV